MFWWGHRLHVKQRDMIQHNLIWYPHHRNIFRVYFFPCDLNKTMDTYRFIKCMGNSIKYSSINLLLSTFCSLKSKQYWAYIGLFTEDRYRASEISKIGNTSIFLVKKRDEQNTIVLHFDEWRTYCIHKCEVIPRFSNMNLVRKAIFQTGFSKYW